MIPKYDELMLPLLKLTSDNKEHTMPEIHDKLAEQYQLTDDELRDQLPSGLAPTFYNRLAWAKTYLKKAGLLEQPRRAVFQISDRGHEILKKNFNKIDRKVLSEFDEFNTFQTIKPKDKKQNVEILSDETPEESLEFAYLHLKDEIRNELLNVVKSSSPAFFERLVVDLLIKIGYGGSRKDAGEAIGKSNDGGIDGTIKEDKLGLDIIYIQAKRWENIVPVKEVRDFAGALLSKKAKKGIFITTSYFPKSAYDFVDAIEHKIILIDGVRLTSLMFENNIGLTTIDHFEIKKIDSDYFYEIE